MEAVTTSSPCSRNRSSTRRLGFGNKGSDKMLVSSRNLRASPARLPTGRSVAQPLEVLRLDAQPVQTVSFPERQISVPEPLLARKSPVLPDGEQHGHRLSPARQLDAGNLLLHVADDARESVSRLCDRITFEHYNLQMAISIAILTGVAGPSTSWQGVAWPRE